MKIKLLIIVLLFSSVLNAQDSNMVMSDPQFLFEQGNEAYKADDFEKSIERYQSVLNEDLESWEIHFNLGNAYFKNGQIPKAILHYEKARKLNPDEEDLLTNLELANLKTVDNVEAKPILAITTWWNRLLNANTIDGWGSKSIIFAFIALGIMLIFLFTHGIIKKISFFAGLFVFLISFIFFFLGQQQKSLQTKHKFAIVFSPSVTVKSAPEDDGTKIFVLHEGTKVKVLQTEGDWSRVSLMNGTKGWVKTEVYEGI